MKLPFILLLTSCIAICFSGRSSAQALPTASGPGNFVAVGGGISGFETDYGHNRIAGAFAYIDANPHWRFGFEGRPAFSAGTPTSRLNKLPWWLSCSALAHAATLVPLRQIPRRRWRDHLSLWLCPRWLSHLCSGAGLDISLTDRLTTRAADFEYQHWVQFPYGALSPYGVSAGLSFRLNGVSRYPKGTRSRH